MHGFNLLVLSMSIALTMSKLKYLRDEREWEVRYMFLNEVRICVGNVKSFPWNILIIFTPAYFGRANFANIHIQNNPKWMCARVKNKKMNEKNANISCLQFSCWFTTTTLWGPRETKPSFGDPNLMLFPLAWAPEWFRSSKSTLQFNWIQSTMWAA